MSGSLRPAKNQKIREMAHLSNCLSFFAGYVVAATTLTQNCGGSAPEQDWGRDKNEDDILLARRILVCNIYKGVLAPNLIAKISGLVENSRAFIRYRDINDEMAQEVILKLE